MGELTYGWPGPIDGPPVWMDASFDQLLDAHPPLQAMRGLLSGTATGLFEGQSAINALQSSYATRRYGDLIYALVRVLQPASAVEIGVYQGLSLLSAAAGLRDNRRGHIAGYDLFDAYPYRHVGRDQVSRTILSAGLDRWATIHQCAAATVPPRYDAVDYLHVDISNDGDTYREVFAQWSGKVRQVILLEGGARERDNVDWMRRYGKPAIAPAIADLRRDYPGWTFTVLQPFPSMTVACNRAAAGAGSPR